VSQERLHIIEKFLNQCHANYIFFELDITLSLASKYADNRHIKSNQDLLVRKLHYLTGVLKKTHVQRSSDQMLLLIDSPPLHNCISMFSNY
jgi:hypothetical protein